MALVSEIKSLCVFVCMCVCVGERQLPLNITDIQTQIIKYMLTLQSFKYQSVSQIDVNLLSS